MEASGGGGGGEFWGRSVTVLCNVHVATKLAKSVNDHPPNFFPIIWIRVSKNGEFDADFESVRL
jgi:hypothetical protein